MTPQKKTRSRRTRRTVEQQIADLEAEIDALKSRVREEKKFDPGAVREDRERLELSRAAYAELVGVSPLTINNWEKGQSKPRAQQLQSWLDMRGMPKSKAWRRLGIEEQEEIAGEEILAERTRLGLSAASYAELLGVSPLTVYSWEHGRSKPRKAQIERLRAVWGMSKEDAWEKLGLEGDFTPEAIAEERERLELSAADYGELVGVSALTIYNWEKGKTKPRAAQLEKWLAVKDIGKRKAWSRLGL